MVAIRRFKMNSLKLTRCPYTLKSHDQLLEKSREHVILDALGGPDGYSVIADKAINNELGRTVDAAFQNDPLVAMLRTKIGVKTRSGISSWSIEGTTVEGNHPVETTFHHNSPIDIHFQKPVLLTADGPGKTFHITAYPEQSTRLLKEIEKSMARKGLKIGSMRREAGSAPGIHGQMCVNLNIIQAGMMKIAYLACCEFLGDSFLDDPLNPEWQKAIRVQNAEEAKQVRIQGFSDAAAFAKTCLPALEEHEHGIAIVNIQQSGPVVVVQLFGGAILSTTAFASETSNYGLEVGSGLLLRCNSLTGAIQRGNWMQYLLEMSKIAIPYSEGEIC